jgi:DNA-binding transcriptional regulator YdaS (Cro superfamily)
MTDFLTNLVERAFERGPVLQRRRPSLFEAAGNATVNREQVQDSDPQPGVEPALELESADSRRESAFKINQTTSESVSSPNVEYAASTRAVVQPKIAPLEERATRLEASTEELQPERSDLAPHRPIETIVERKIEKSILPAPVDSGAPTRREAQAVVSPALHPPAPSRQVNPVSAVAVETKSTRPATWKKDADAAATPLRPARVPSPRQEPPVVPAFHSSPPAIEQPQPPAPTIQVTIGRIEVRAVTQSPGRPQPARPAQPKLSLEDYLRSRGEGNR